MESTSKNLVPPAAPRWLPTWAAATLPLVLLAALLAVFAFGNPLVLFTGDLPPVEELSIQRVVVTAQGFEIDVLNSGPDPVTIAQVIVDDAFWPFTAHSSATLSRLGSTTLSINYPWVEYEPHRIVLLTSTGLTFEHEVALATETPRPNIEQFLAYGLLGVYVGIIPVALGMLWLPAMRSLGRRGLNAILALTVGLLIFLLVDTLEEVFEHGAAVPGVFQGVPLALFAALLTVLGLSAIGSYQRTRHSDPSRQRLYVATLIALSIGLHNMGEGLAIGTAFALGEAALGSFLVIGFTLHNITEGVGIAAPLTRDRPGFARLAGLALLAGAPAILGAWLGGLSYSPLLGTLFLGIGVGAIAQVIIEIGRLLLRDAQQSGRPAVNWLNVGGLALGIAVMYLTAFLVSF